ncbi:MAG: TraR/DksA C4-type zinc finger protein [Patescibacteria group bacterium]
MTEKFPANLLTPVGRFLQNKLELLKKRKKDISKEDPFNDPSRVTDNAATDTEADEQFGHARTSALRKELSRAMVQIRKALTRVRLGKYGICEECGQMIDTDRLIIYPEATLCAKDSAKREK